MIKLFLLLFFTFSINLIAQDTLKSFDLISGHRTKKISSLDRIQLYRDSMPIKNDFINRRYFGQFLFLRHDSIAINPTYYRDDTLNGSPFAKLYITPSHSDTIIKLDIKEINRIVYQRTKFPKIMRYSFYASAVTALIISPLVSIEKGGFNKDRFKTISGISGGTAFLTLIFGLASSEKHYELIPAKKKKRIWTVRK